MATLIRPDGSELEVQPGGDDGSRAFTLAELYRHLGCDQVQMIALPDGRELWCDEEAYFREPPPPVNRKATQLYRAAGGIPEWQVLGSVLVTTVAETTEPEDD